MSRPSLRARPVNSVARLPANVVAVREVNVMDAMVAKRSARASATLSGKLRAGFGRRSHHATWWERSWLLMTWAAWAEAMRGSSPGGVASWGFPGNSMMKERSDGDHAVQVSGDDPDGDEGAAVGAGR